MSAQIVVLITAGSSEAGLEIARTLVRERLVACVNLIAPIRSVYRWQRKVQEDQEVLLIAKTASERFDQLAARVQDLHSYDIPEIIALPIMAGSQNYMDWIAEQLGPPHTLGDNSEVG